MVHDPTWVFFIVLMIILFAPIIMGKLRIPHIIGLVLFGIVIGEYGLNVVSRDMSFETFGKIGLYYIMFLASLEMDMDGLRKNISKISIFGILSFAIPFILTYATFRWMLGYSDLTALLLGCIMSSNTLVAYPIVGRYGLQRKPGVTLSVGGTMISLFLSLLTLAGIVSSHSADGGAEFWVMFTLKFALFVAVMVFIVPRITRWFLRNYSDSVMQYVFVMSIVVAAAGFSQAVGIEGVFGAFFAGIVLNRYIPHVSPLMNRIEFIGNAIFIPYFLIGVGMLINLHHLFYTEGVFWIVLLMVLFGTAGKALAAYLATTLFGMHKTAGHIICGLTSAHAAGAIAMVMVGLRLEIAPGEFVITDAILSSVVIMILFTCVISSIITEKAAQSVVLHDNEMPTLDTADDEEERILIPIKYPEYANRLVSLALLMRKDTRHPSPKLPSPSSGGMFPADNGSASALSERKWRKNQKSPLRGDLGGSGASLIALNVVYDNVEMEKNRVAGHKLLEQVTKHAASADAKITTQVRIAANIANGIRHAFNEYRASEIIIGLHFHEVREAEALHDGHQEQAAASGRGFWGEFHQSLFNGLNRQIIMARLHTPLNTIRKIHVAVPSRSQYEPGFYRYLDRLGRMSARLDCGIYYNARQDTLDLIRQYMQTRYPQVRAKYYSMEHWNEMPALAETIREDHLFVVVTARKGTISHKNAQERLPEELSRHFRGKNLMIIFPDQYGEPRTLSFAQTTHTEQTSAYDNIKQIMHKMFG